MQNNYFQFKQFKVYHHKSSMKVGTDAVLLACLCPSENINTILDIGCGSGIIPLIMAQKSPAQITGIDIDNSSIEQSKENFNLSQWSHRLSAKHISIQEYAQETPNSFDLIISNPPFFIKSTKSPTASRNLARHNDTLSFLDLILSAKNLLKPEGTFSLVLPRTEGEDFIDLAVQNGFFLKKKNLIFPKASKAYNRMIFDLCLYPTHTLCRKLTIREENNDYTQAYKELTRDLYLAF